MGIYEERNYDTPGSIVFPFRKWQISSQVGTDSRVNQLKVAYYNFLCFFFVFMATDVTVLSNFDWSTTFKVFVAPNYANADLN